MKYRSRDEVSTPDFPAILEGASDELVNDPVARKYYLGEDFRT